MKKFMTRQPNQQERYDKIIKNKRDTKLLFLAFIISFIVYMSYLIIHGVLVDELGILLALDIMFIIISILEVGMIVYFIYKAGKLNKEKQQLINGYTFKEFIKFNNEINALEYAKYFGVKPSIELSELKENDIELFNKTIKNRKMLALNKKWFTILLFLYITLMIIIGILCYVYDTIFLNILIAIIIALFFLELIIPVIISKKLEDEYQKLIFSFEYKDFLKYINENE
ncbi:MAG: hypothetical protein ACLRFL_03155 [Clostridia bacterium]